MSNFKRWEPRRWLTLLVVAALHMALLSWLLSISAEPGRRASVPQSIELIYLPMANLPKIRSANSPPRLVRGETHLTTEPPVLDLPASSAMTAGSAADSSGDGSGVDWAAEARRALQAYEIRAHKRASTTSNPGPPTEDTWWPHTQHRAGEQYKTASGDWIVWINASCYQVAGTGGFAYTPGAVVPQTICLPQHGVGGEAGAAGDAGQPGGHREPMPN